MDLKLSHKGLEPQVELERSSEAGDGYEDLEAMPGLEGWGFCLLSVLQQTGERRL